MGTHPHHNAYSPAERLRQVVATPTDFTAAGQVTLRPYQSPVAEAVYRSICEGAGKSFCLVVSRQGGKNEVEAALQAFLLFRLQYTDASIVIASPTFKPQTENAMRRLETALQNNPLTRGRWKKESGYIFRMGQARAIFFSGEPTANVVGATAKTLLMADEAQDITPAKWDKDFAPMAASTNATKLFCGTVWTSDTLLAREMRAAREAQSQRDPRLFMADADAVGRIVPAYKKHTAEQVKRLGREHPLIKTQYYLEEIGAEGGLFPPSRIKMMSGGHARQISPSRGEAYVFGIDIGGADEDHPANIHTRARESRHDSTALTIARLSTESVATTGKPTYEILERFLWTGVKHVQQNYVIRAFIHLWKPTRVIVDATGIGAGLASFLADAFPDVVLPFIFTSKSKSDLGWGFVAAIDSGRWREHARGQKPAPEQELFFEQAAACQYEVRPGPGQFMAWSVPDNQRRPVSGELLHDDVLVSGALLTILDSEEWYEPQANSIIHKADPLTHDRDY